MAVLPMKTPEEPDASAPEWATIEQVFADTGEDAIVYCPTSDYAANIELAEAVAPALPRGAPTHVDRRPGGER